MFRSFNLSISKAPKSPADILPGHAHERHSFSVVAESCILLHLLPHPNVNSSRVRLDI